MQIHRKTRNVAKYLGHLKKGDKYLLGLNVSPTVAERLGRLGFSTSPAPGERLLPPAKMGPACRINAEGFAIVHRHQPMETGFRQTEWRWTQFAGRDQTEEVSKIVDVPYQRYPRTWVGPYGIELELRARADGRAFAIAGSFANDEQDIRVATNTANMLLEALGGFEVLDEHLTGWIRSPVRQLNWELLPPGKNPWSTAQPLVEAMVQRMALGNQPVLRARLEAVGSKGPDFIAVGRGGFDGYTAFGFEGKRLCVLECPYVNNATFVLPLNSWEAISRLTKAEILEAKFHEARLVHNRGWFASLDELLGDIAKAA